MQHKYDFSVLLGTCIKLACQALEDSKPSSAPGYDYCPHGYQLPSYPNGRCPSGCSSASAFNCCQHRSVYGACQQYLSSCAHSAYCPCGYTWASSRCGHRNHRPGDPNSQSSLTPKATQHLLPWLRLAVDLQLDALSKACMARLKAMPSKQLAGVVEGHMDELLALDKRRRDEVNRLLVAALRAA